MKKQLVRRAVPILFKITGRQQAALQIQKWSTRYRALTEGVDKQIGSAPVRVPPMMGVDEDMRNWSLFMILEHNAIVNGSIHAIVQGLARNQEPMGKGVIDPKRDVMPSKQAGPEQVAAFDDSVAAYLQCLASLPRLRGTRTKRHPIFGRFDAHQWHCMFALHLRIHYKQAAYVVQAAGNQKA